MFTIYKCIWTWECRCTAVISALKRLLYRVSSRTTEKPCLEKHMHMYICLNMMKIKEECNEVIKRKGKKRKEGSRQRWGRRGRGKETVDH